MSWNQWTPQKTRAIPTIKDKIRKNIPRCQLKNSSKKENPKIKDAWPDGNEGFFGTGIKTFELGSSAGRFSL